MNLDKIGIFIKELRTEGKISQQKLADMIPVDRSVVSKWERGEVLPPIDKMIALCNIFNISIEELVSGVRITDDNKEEQKKNLFDYLLNENTKYKKIKIFAIVSSILVLVISFMFLLYYFTQTYNTQKVYKVYGTSDNYEIKDGLLVITRENSYIKIGTINDEIYDITLIYKDGDKEYELYTGSSDSILVDFSGYNSKITNDNINIVKDNLYIQVNDEEIKLYLKEDYKNDNLILQDQEDALTDGSESKDSVTTISNKIKKDFKCDEIVCTKEVNNIKIDYFIDENIFYIKDNDINIQYNVNNNTFEYESSKLIFTLKDNNITCGSKTCDNYKDEYNKYYTNLIEQYLN